MSPAIRRSESRLTAQVSRIRAVKNGVKSNRVALSPGPVLWAGLFGASVWIVAMAVFFELSNAQLVIVGSTGIVGALSGALGAMWQAHRARETKEVLERAEHSAAHDALTGLTNRPAMLELLETSLIEAKQNDTVTGVLFLDLNRFKMINDSMGHEAGDELLRIVANRLTAAVRGTDIVARFGGDEFVVIARHLLNDRSVIAIVEQILRSFEKKVSLFGGSQVVGTSIGVAIARPEDERTGEELLRDADVAMYKAKRSRSGYAVFDDAQRQQVIDKLDIERDLTQAIEEQQLVVFYQPLVDVAERKLYGFEALVRWNHPIRGTISPGEFLPVAEETGMMARIGEMVLREAAAQAAVWNHLSPHAHHLKMSVNVAEQQLLDGDFPDLVAEVLAWSGLPASQLVLEITENVIVDHLDGLGVLDRLYDLGVSLAIDDFGTGQSSLSYVRQFDMVSTLKIDKTFVENMDAGESNRAIIEAIVAMSRSLNLRMIAEGVEHAHQVTQLSELGVSIMQGYLFNKPVSASGIDPAVWFAPPEDREPKAPVGLTSLEVSRQLAAESATSAGAVAIHERPAPRG